MFSTVWVAKRENAFETAHPKPETKSVSAVFCNCTPKTASQSSTNQSNPLRTPSCPLKLAVLSLSERRCYLSGHAGHESKSTLATSTMGAETLQKQACPSQTPILALLAALLPLPPFPAGAVSKCTKSACCQSRALSPVHK